MAKTQNDRIALVTGANKGIGFQTARLLGLEGMTVLVGSRDAERGAEAEKALREEGADARALALDVTDAESVRAAAARVEADFGRLDVLVNNAGVAMGWGGIGDTDPNTFLRTLEVNVVGTVTVTDAFLDLLRRSESARVVNVSSEIGSIGTMTDPASPFFAMEGNAGYPASKAAVNMVTALYAKALAPAGAKVNAANPGYCETDLNHNTGHRTPEQGARVSLHLATLPDDGPSGVLWGHLASEPDPESYGVLPW
ncbi:NAD(P)-dependent dehydrogenase (short-subunit alcohol dehydrogenase family) [Nocardiopsis arvandica]|uniref:NAD(P)-dependent dehydrogenase (Short-subunit alcohol dehydrogenase family) n=1 Tax=Nocardiopsis sinuspersici TaxID=501010 RepID=A0A7Z0BL13_9ACTN|nr:SDR family NAD(P)-dependent oxidoreductase [Nocardiopsis sinuspersici]NYH53057.1 NAD(P)-dependent dehydrogenase (short-subunit alcohol dehydrogenase family) [Nocardiopsis sinuspersici]